MIRHAHHQQANDATDATDAVASVARDTSIASIARIDTVRSVLDPTRQVTAPIQRWQDSGVSSAQDELVVEEPLELLLAAPTDGQATTATPPTTLAAIMRTPGNDVELVAGFLLSEGLLTRRTEIAIIATGTDADGLPSANSIVVAPAPGIDLAQRAQQSGYSRLFAVNSSCGVCGKNSVAAACAMLPPLPSDDFTVSAAMLYTLPEQLRTHQQVFSHTGGLHAAGLFDEQGKLLWLREDVGRHNAVDKLVGRALLDDHVPLGRHVLLVSGRLSFEIILKAWVAGIPVVAAVSAPSSLAVDLADAAGITLVAFLRGTTANVYTHTGRVRE